MKNVRVVTRNGSLVHLGCRYAHHRLLGHPERSVQVEVLPDGTARILDTQGRLICYAKGRRLARRRKV